MPSPTVRRYRLLLALLAAIAMAACTTAAAGKGAVSRSGPTASASGPSPATAESETRDGDKKVDAPAEPPTAVPPSDTTDPGPVTCPAPSLTVRTADELGAALQAAVPGQTIQLADGSYEGTFVATAKGSATAPIFLCGSKNAVLFGGGIKAGYVLHLDGGEYWRLVGFTARHGQKGIVADRVQHSVIQGVTVAEIGDEAIHLRTHSSDNIVRDSLIGPTGLRRDKFGEGLYVGSASSNWCRYTDCQPDRSDRNVMRNNAIAQTTAEAVDVKEGTSGGLIIGNTFDGSALTGADSWVDIKGNGWLITGNIGRNSPLDGYQTHEVYQGWGTNNVFRGNTAEVAGPGLGFHLAPAKGNTVSCDNQVSGAAKGFANLECAG